MADFMIPIYVYLWWNSLVVHLIDFKKQQASDCPRVDFHYKNHGMSLVSAFQGSVFDTQISIHINEIEQPIDELYDNQHTKF